jgi:hypothetical protein
MAAWGGRRRQAGHSLSLTARLFILGWWSPTSLPSLGRLNINWRARCRCGRDYVSKAHDQYSTALTDIRTTLFSASKARSQTLFVDPNRTPLLVG